MPVTWYVYVPTASERMISSPGCQLGDAEERLGVGGAVAGEHDVAPGPERGGPGPVRRAGVDDHLLDALVDDLVDTDLRDLDPAELDERDAVRGRWAAEPAPAAAAPGSGGGGGAGGVAAAVASAGSTGALGGAGAGTMFDGRDDAARARSTGPGPGPASRRPRRAPDDERERESDEQRAGGSGTGSLASPGACRTLRYRHAEWRPVEPGRRRRVGDGVTRDPGGIDLRGPLRRDRAPVRRSSWRRARRGAAHRHPDPRVRAAALAALVRSGSSSAGHTAWRAGVSTRSAAVRRRAAELAPALEPAPVVGLLRLLTDADPLVAETAAWALGEIDWTGKDPRPGGGRAVAAAPAPRRPAGPRVGGRRARRDRRPRAACPRSSTACADRPPIRRRAVLALAPFDGPEVEAALARALTDSDWQVRQAAEDLR